MPQIVQILGALAILAGFVLAQLGRLEAHSRRYLVLNLAGSGVLAADAWLGRQWGFVLLEGMWALVSGWSLAAGVLFRQPSGDGSSPPSG